MPIYPGNSSATILRTNQQIFLFQQELQVAGTRSIAVQLERISRSFYPFGASFELYFTDVNGNPANPGTYEVDIQTADIDLSTHYCTINAFAGAGALNASFVGRLELPNFWAKYVCAVIKTLTNSVYTSLLVTR